MSWDVAIFCRRLSVCRHSKGQSCVARHLATSNGAESPSGIELPGPQLSKIYRPQLRWQDPSRIVPERLARVSSWIHGRLVLPCCISLESDTVCKEWSPAKLICLGCLCLVVANKRRRHNGAEKYMRQQVSTMQPNDKKMEVTKKMNHYV